MPDFLFIDTAAQTATIALANEDNILATEQLNNQKEQAAVINIMIENVLKKAGKTLKDIDCFCLCAGPGSYTGLRVSMSLAKGMAFALQKPLICFNRLQLIALSYPNNLSPSADKAVILQARKGEYFRAVYTPDGMEKEPASHIFEEELDQKISPDQTIITDCSELPVNNEKIILPPTFSPDIKAWSVLAQQSFQGKQFADLAYAEPFYLKAAFTTTPKPKI